MLLTLRFRLFFQTLHIVQTIDGQQPPGLDVQIFVKRQTALHTRIQPVHLHQFFRGIDVGCRRMAFLPLCLAFPREDRKRSVTDPPLQQMQQLQGAAARFGLVVHALHALVQRH